MKEWRCFHCDEVFADEAAAREHFGETLCDDPACQIDIADVRAMEKQIRLYQTEDTDLMRTIATMSADHVTALRSAEEEGYARGLRDGSLAEESKARIALLNEALTVAHKRRAAADVARIDELEAVLRKAQAALHPSLEIAQRVAEVLNKGLP